MNMLSTIKKYKTIILASLLILLIIKIIHYCYTKQNFPFPIYDFSRINADKFKQLTSSDKPVLFTNTLKNNIEWDNFCDILSDKELNVRYGDYGTVRGRKERTFTKENMYKVCKNIKSSNGYGGNNIITKDEQRKIGVEFNNHQLNIFRDGKLWIGPEKSRTPLHKDRPDNLAIQIHGNKKWMFFNKKDNKYLCFDDNNSKLEWSNYSIGNIFSCPSAILSKKYEITMTPGDMLYLPSQWAHDVENVTDSIMMNLWY